MKRFIFFLIPIALLVACSSNGSQNGAEPTILRPTEEPVGSKQLIRAEVSRTEQPDVSQEEVRELVDGHNRFAFDLYATVRQKSDSNLIYSPLSISQAFSMVYAGARGETEAEIGKVFYYLPQERQHPAQNFLDQHLSGLAEQSDSHWEPFHLHIAQATWGQEGFPFQDAYLTTLAEHYGAGLYQLDFVQKSDEAIEIINAWVAQQTENRIQDLASPDMITPQTLLVLVNAVYFKASWLFPFEESATQDGAFTLLDGKQVTVASAATLVEMEVMALERAEMTINRPFIFAIVEQETGTILFLGRVMNPAQ